MQTPFEIPYTSIEREVNHHQRILRPYLDELIQHDMNEHETYANPYNRYKPSRDGINEDLFEFWIENSEDEVEVDKLNNSSDEGESSDSDSESESDRDRDIYQRETSKAVGSKSSKKNKKAKNEVKIIHDTHIINEIKQSNEFNSNEIIHLKQQVNMSISSRNKKRKLPDNVLRENIKRCQIMMSGMEPRVTAIEMNQVSFSKYTKRVVDNLFYITLYRGDYQRCYKLYCILINSFNVDIQQIWNLGVFILSELSFADFQSKMNEFFEENNMEKPDIDMETLRDLSLVKNPQLLNSFNGVDSLDAEIIKEFKAGYRNESFTKILKFLKLLLRIYKNQAPLFGIYPEQSYSGDALVDRKYDESTYKDEEDDNVEESIPRMIASQPVVKLNKKSEEKEEKQDRVDTTDEETASLPGDTEKNESDISTSDEESYSDTEDAVNGEIGEQNPFPIATPSSETIPQKDDFESESEEIDSDEELISHTTSEIRIKTSQFKLPYDRPYQHNYIQSLSRHSAPIHRHGSRLKVPMQTLTYLWRYLQVGSFKELEDELKPLMLVVPTSTDGRISLMEIMNQIMELVSALQNDDDQELNHTQKDFEDFEDSSVRSIDDFVNMYMHILKSFKKWNKLYSYRRRKPSKTKKNEINRSSKKFIGVDGIVDSLSILKTCIDAKRERKEKEGLELDEEENITNDSQEQEKIVSDLENGYDIHNHDEIESDYQDEEEQFNKQLKGSPEEKDVSEDETFYDAEEDDEEIRKEMERLMGYT